MMTPAQREKYKSISSSLSMALAWLEAASTMLNSTPESAELFRTIKGYLLDCKKALEEKK
jgi:hypothetical protein